MISDDYEVVPINPNELDSTKKVIDKEFLFVNGKYLERAKFKDVAIELGFNQNTFEFKAITPDSDKPEKTGLYFPLSGGVYINYGNISISNDEWKDNILFIVYDGYSFELIKKPIDFIPKGIIEPDNNNSVSGGEVYNFTKKKVSNIYELRKIKGIDGQIIDLLGYYSELDKPIIQYKWISSNDGIVDNGGDIIVVEDGHWKSELNGNIDVRDFGLVGDGLFDNTDVFNNMVNNVNNCVLIFDGYYRFNNTIYIPEFDSNNSKQFLFKGLGKLSAGGKQGTINDGMCQLLYYGDSSFIKSTSKQTWCEFDSLMIRDMTNNENTVGVDLLSYKSQKMNQVYILGFGTNLKIIGDYYYTVFEKCSFSHAKKENIFANGLANGVNFIDTRISLSKGWGFYSEIIGDNINFTNCYIEGNAKAGINIRNFRVCNIIGGYIEHNGEKDVSYNNRKCSLLFYPYSNNVGVNAVVNINGSYIMTDDQVDCIITASNTGSANGIIDINIYGVALPMSLIKNNFDSSLPTHIVYNTSRDRVKLTFHSIGYQFYGNDMLLFNGRKSEYINVTIINDQLLQKQLGYNLDYITPNIGKINIVNENQRVNTKDTDIEAFLDLDTKSTKSVVVRFFRFTKSLVQKISLYNDNVEKIYLDSITGKVKADSYRVGLFADILVSDILPEGNIVANQGSICSFRNGDNSELYFKKSGTQKTGWVKITT